MAPSNVASTLLDPSYGQQGVSYPDDRLISINASVITDGGRLCVGQASFDDGWGYVIMRVDNAGKLDPKFGDAGMTCGRFKQGYNSAAFGIHVLGEHIFITGSYHDDATMSSEPAFARFHKDGTIDKAFGENGNKVIDLPAPHRQSPASQSVEAVTTSALVEDGILVSYQYPFEHTVIMKFKSDGEYDKRFNKSGYKFLKPADSTESSGHVALAIGDKIYITGSTIIKGIAGPYIACLKSTGDEDKEFGLNGYLLSELKSGLMFADLAQLDTNGSFVCFASVGVSQGFITAFSQTGEKLLGFNDSLTDFGGSGGQWTRGHVCTSTRKIIATGSTLGGDEADVVVGRFELDGTPDLTFGEHDGWGRIALGDSIDLAVSSSLEKDGKTIVTGSDFESDRSRKGFLLRCLTNS